MKKNSIVIFLLFFVGLVEPVQAEIDRPEVSERSRLIKTEGESYRAQKKLGIFFGAFDPFPSFLSMNLAYQASDHVLVTAGLGTLVFGFTLSAGGRYLFLADSRFSPYFGIGFNQTSMVNFFSTRSQEPFMSSTVSSGFEWRTHSGFMLTLGVNWMWYQSRNSNEIGLTLFPGLNVGWFF